MLTLTRKRLATQVTAKGLSRGMMIKLGQNKYGQVTNKKEVTATGTLSFDYKLLDDSGDTGKLRLKSYETVDVVDSRMIVEVERVDAREGIVYTSAKKGLDKLQVPMSLIPETIKDIKPGVLLNVVMEGDEFVTVLFEGHTASR